jgi:hypothetical protein
MYLPFKVPSSHMHIKANMPPPHPPPTSSSLAPLSPARLFLKGDSYTLQSSEYKMYGSRIFAFWFVEKEGCLGTYKRSSTKQGDTSDFCIQQQRTLNSFQEFKIETKFFKTYRDGTRPTKYIHLIDKHLYVQCKGMQLQQGFKCPQL